MDNQVVAPVGVDGGPGRQWDSLFINGRPQVEILHELLNVNAELAQLGGERRPSHGHLCRNGAPQSSYVVIYLGRGHFLQFRGLRRHLGDKDTDVTGDGDPSAR